MTGFRSVRAVGIVLRHGDWSEADRIITLYTQEQGKIRAVVKGARKITSRKAGHVEPFTKVKVQLSRGRDLFILSQAEMLDAFLPLHDDLTLTGYASYVAELLDRFVYEEEGPNPTLFRLLSDTLKRLSSGEDSWLAVRHYEIRLLDFLGFRPQLVECANCGREIQAEDQYYSFSLGGVICPRCGKGLPNLEKISLAALKYLRHFQRSTYGEVKRARPAKAVKVEVEMLMQGYFTYILERELNSPRFMKRVNK